MKESVYQRLLAISDDPAKFMDSPAVPPPEQDSVRILPSLYRGTEQIALMPTPWRGEEIPHRHADIEISYLLTGSVSMQVEAQRFDMQPGDFLVLDTNCVHCPNVRTRDSLLIGINVRPTFFDDLFFHRFYQTDPITSFFAKAIYSGKSVKQYLYFHAQDNSAVRECVEQMLEEYYEPQICSQEMVESLMMIFFSQLIRLHAMRPDQTVWKKSSSQLPQLSNMIGFMNAHLDTVTRADIAAQFGYSYSYITKIIRDTTGSGFTELRRTLRLQHAEKLLLTTELPVIQVSQMSGFSSASDFYKFFRNAYGITPQEYRTRHKRS